METRIYDVSAFTEETLRLADLHGDREARRAADEALAAIGEAADALRRGGLVAFPTETVYGLGADAFCEGAVRKVYEVKGRPSDNPMIVHIARASDVAMLTPGLSPDMVRLIDAFWPGPLTLVAPKRPELPGAVTGGLGTVAMRMPDCAAAVELIRRAGSPVAAPSANISGRPSPTRGEHAVRDLDGAVDVILVGGECRVGIESTVLDVSGPSPTVLRPGIIGPDDIAAVIGREVGMDPALRGRGEALADGAGAAAPKAPGMKYRHYAPKAEMLVLEGRRDRVEGELSRLKALNEGVGRKVGVLLFDEKAFVEAAHGFFARLREMDDEGVDLILAGALSESDSLGFAVMNRMLRAAGYNVARV
ncbi:MAG: threonylcarbamoyl-AMP synthase [Clostridiales Family XIII bacterium]|jgi:L-threonylcarbamoyladenylate synthase|nr:threonylcarbamoyl-AMP synthase [Clostridiales Family XIII bacterium]